MRNLFLPSCLLVLLSAGDPASAMNAEEFDAYTQGKTFFYESEGRAYGAEEYLPNRRVRWTFLNDECREGEWYEDNGMICFVYDFQPEPQCWSFEISGDRLKAQFENDPSQTELYEVRQSPEPLMCLGPDVGV